MCVRLAVGIGLFRTIADREPSAVSAAELAKSNHGDQTLICKPLSPFSAIANAGKVRIMRILTGAGYATEVDEARYAANAVTRAMTTKVVEACIKHR